MRILWLSAALLCCAGIGLGQAEFKFTADDGAPGDHFGYAVSIDGDTILVGAAADDDCGDASGSAYVFTRTGDLWSEQAKLVASDPAYEARFGYSVAISGDTAIIGADLDDHGGIEESGSAYVFTRAGGA